MTPKPPARAEGAPANRCILHADMDAFYASVEQRDRPELRGRPVAVGGDGSRGVVAAASYEARQFGVRSAMPSFEAKRLCPEMVFLRGDMGKYARESRKIFRIFGDFSPSVEGLSLDEAFLDLTGTERLLGPPTQVGEDLRARVRRETGLVVSVGIAPVKMVAKMASGAAKPDGLLVLRPEQVQDFLAPLPVRRLWGGGPVSESRLRSCGFETLGDLAQAGPERLRGILGAEGERWSRLARGLDEREVQPNGRALSYSEENTFSADIEDRSRLSETLLVHSESVARRLRRDGVRARTVVLKWRDARRTRAGGRGYPLHTRQCTVLEATDDGRVITQEARRLFLESGPDGPIRLIGVGVSGVEDRGIEQLSLFQATGLPRGELPRSGREALNRAVDGLNDRFGPGAVVRAGARPADRAGLSLQIKRGEAFEESESVEDD
ncbi:DNA polymerase IV [Myxococcota bacterium]|nr:DNA polymerase IV [Myxococcota bacterium]